MAQNISLIDPRKWELLHQEGALLLEQINRKVESFPVPDAATTDQSTRTSTIAYIERSIQRLSNIETEYLTLYESFHNEVKYIRTAITTKFSNTADSQPRASRGSLNTELSPTDVAVTYDSILAIYQRELTNKLDIIALFQTILQSKLDQYLQAANDCKSTLQSTSQGITSTTTQTHQLTSAAPNYLNLIELYPWVEQIFDQINPALTPEENQTNDLLFHAKFVDLNGVIALFYKRAGFDLAQLNRLTSIILSAIQAGGSDDVFSSLADIIKSHSSFSPASPS
jgi:hypothetical protein